MSSSNDSLNTEDGEPIFSPLAGLLSYLVPGLGQISQGRVGKGILFMVCLYGMFFYGWALGSWSNVYLPEPLKVEPNVMWPQKLGSSLLLRLPYCCQFWIGAIAWPSLIQWNDNSAKPHPILGNLQRSPPESGQINGWTGKSLNQLQSEGDKTWDLGLVYTMIAGILNILVIYDAVAGPAFEKSESPKPKLPPDTSSAPPTPSKTTDPVSV